jgi:hypothetical protein
MIRLNPNARPESWTTCEINLDGEPQPMRVRFWLLPPEEAARLSAERLRGFSAVRAEGDAGIDYLLRELSAEQIGEVRQTLAERIVDWDLEDASAEAGGKLSLDPAHIAAVLGHGAFLRPLYQGLIDASSGAARKNA